MQASIHSEDSNLKKKQFSKTRDREINGKSEEETLKPESSISPEKFSQESIT